MSRPNLDEWLNRAHYDYDPHLADDDTAVDRAYDQHRDRENNL